MTVVLEARDVVKRYGHVTALNGACFEAHEGEVTALIGDNGAGKSTFVKVLSGVIAPDGGEINLAGARTDLRLAPARQAARDRDGLPGPGARAGPRPGRQRLRRARAVQAGLARAAAHPRQGGDAPPGARGVRLDGNRRQGHVRARGGAVRRPEAERRDLPLGDVGQQGPVPRRAHGGARRAPDPQRAAAGASAWPSAGSR